jgi:hypothetical protein
MICGAGSEGDGTVDNVLSYVYRTSRAIPNRYFTGWSKGDMFLCNLGDIIKAANQRKNRDAKSNSDR